MPRRIELELTSERPDGSWTWRAAGAREPKGELDGSILPSGAKVGDVLRAEADFDIEGITVLSVLPPKGGRQEPERIEILGPQREFTPVTSTLVGKGDRGDRRGGHPVALGGFSAFSVGTSRGVSVGCDCSTHLRRLATVVRGLSS